MSLEIIGVFAILSAAIVLFVTNKYSPDVVALGTVLALALSRILSITEALAGFANPAVITIASIFLITAGLSSTGVAARIGGYLFRIAGKKEAHLIAVTMGASALLSLVMNNIASASVLLPGLSSITRRTRISPSKLMIPLSFGTLLGGMATLFTTVNLLANDALRQSGLVPFHLWDFFRIGGILSLAGIAFMVTLGRKLLPNHPVKETLEVHRIPEDLIRLYRLPDLVFQAHVVAGSPLSGKSIAESQLGRTLNINIIGLLRGRRIKLAPGANDILRAGDMLVLEGERQRLEMAQKQLGLTLEPAGDVQNVELEDPYIGVVEAIVSPHAGITGRSLREIHFRQRFGLAALAIMREGEPIVRAVSDTPLHFGDTLLVQGPRRRIRLLNEERDFIVLEEPSYLGEIGRPERAPWALLGMGLMLLTAGLGLLPIAAASLLGALTMLLAGVLKSDEAYQAIEWKAVVMVGGMLSLGAALGKSGAADLISRNLLHVLSPWGPPAVLAGFFLISMLLAQILSGAATMVLIAPIALSTAAQIHISAHPLLMTALLGASSGFLTPVSHPVNVLVMGPGGYTFGDYAKVGCCLGTLVFLLVMVLVPFFWPL